MLTFQVHRRTSNISAHGCKENSNVQPGKL